MNLFEKVDKEQAVRPNAFFSIPTFVRDEDAKKKGITDEERILGTGAQTEFWKTFKGITIQVVSELDEANSQAMAQGLSFEEIGKNTLVINMTKQIIKRIVEKVEDAKESLEQAVNEK